MSTAEWIALAGVIVAGVAALIGAVIMPIVLQIRQHQYEEREQREAELRQTAIQLAQIKGDTGALRDAFDKHTEEDNKRFDQVDRKLDGLVPTRVKGGQIRFAKAEVKDDPA